jgi:hypothetical protein
MITENGLADKAGRWLSTFRAFVWLFASIIDRDRND